MAVTKDDLLLNISVNTANAVKQIDNVAESIKDLNQTASKTADGVSGFGASFVKMNVGLNFAIENIKMLGSAIESITKPFLMAEDAITKLRQSLEIAGSKTVSASIESFIELGDSIENVGVASTEQILALARLGTAAGQTAEQTEKLIKAAADLSVARDIPLESAFRALSNSLKGSSGALANFLPELKDLTEEQNRAGFAIEYVSASLGGFAARNLETYSGKIEVLKTRFGDVGEEIGHIITDILDLNSAVEGSTSYLASLQNTLIQNRATFVSIGKVMVAPFIYLKEVIEGLVDSAMGAFGFLQVVVGKLILSFGQLQVWTDKLAKRSTSMGDAMIRTGQEMLDTGMSYTKAFREITVAAEPLAETPKVLEDTAKKADTAAKSLKNMRSQIMTKEQLSALEELKKKVEEYGKAAASIGVTEAENIKRKAQADIAELKALEAKAKGNNQELLAMGIKNRMLQEQLELSNLYDKSLEDIGKKNMELMDISRQFDATERQRIQYEMESKIKLIEAEQRKLDLTDEGARKVNAALEVQKGLLMENAEIAKSMADMEFMDWVDNLSASIKGAFGPDIFDRLKTGFDSVLDYVAENPVTVFVKQQAQSATAGMSDGLASAGSMIKKGAGIAMDAAGAIASGLAKAGGWVGQVIDVIMNADKYLKVLIDMPKMLLDVLKKMPQLIDEIIKTFPDMIGALAEAVPSILVTIVEKIPALIESIAKSLPNLVEKLAEALPEILIKLIGNIPKIMVILAKAIVDIALGFIKGIIKGIGNLLKGVKIPKVQVDTKGISKDLKKLSGATGGLFKVSDLTDAVKDPVKDMMEGIEETFKKGTNWIKQAWQWVMDKIINPLINMLKAVWDGIVNLLKGVWDIAKQIFNAIVQAFSELWEVAKQIFMALWDAAKQIFEATVRLFSATWEIAKQIFNAIIQAFSAVWEAAKQIFNAVIEAFASVWESAKGAFVWIFDMFAKVWDGLSNAVKNAFSFLTSIGETIAKPIKEAFTGITDFFKNIGDAFKSLFKFDFSGFASSMATALKGALEPVFKILKTPVNAIIDFINSLKLPGFEVGFSVLGKKISFGWGETDLVPGDIQRLAKGGMVTGTDTVPALLSPGEFIMSRPAVNQIGLNNLRSMNAGEAMGGSNTYNIDFEINIDAKTTMDEGFIRGTLIPRMQDEMKRASLEGKFVLSQKGIR